MSNPEIKNSPEIKKRVNIPVVTKSSRIAGITSVLCIAALLGVNFIEPVTASGQSPTIITSVVSSKEISTEQPQVEIICKNGMPDQIELTGKIPIGIEGASFIIVEITPESPSRRDELRGTISLQVDSFGKAVVFDFMEGANGNTVRFIKTIDKEVNSIYDPEGDSLHLSDGGKYQIFIISGSGRGMAPFFRIKPEDLITATDPFVFEYPNIFFVYPEIVSA